MTIGVGSAIQYVNRKIAANSATTDKVTGNTTPSSTATMRPGPAAGMTQDPVKPMSMAPNPAPQSVANPQDGAFHSQVGDNVNSYIQRTSAKLGENPGYTTQAGQTYADQVTKGLTSPDASSVNAQNTEDTAASRRAYLARMQAQQSIGQSGFGAGTAQAQRMQDQSQAGVDSANQAGQSSVNAYIRQRTQDNQNNAKDLEATQYGKVRNNLADATNQASTLYNQNQDSIHNQQWNTTNSQNQDQRSFENAQVLKGSDDAAKQKLIAGLPEGPAKNKVMAGLADGSLTPQTALNSVMNTDGTIKGEYAGATPGALGLKAETEYAQQTVDLQNPNLKTSDPQAYQAAINAEVLKNRQAQTGPVNKAAEGATLDDARKALATGGKLDQKQIDALKTSGDIAPYEVSSLPTGSDAKSLVGKTVSVGSDTYKVTNASYTRTSGGGGNSPRHTDWTEITSLDGGTKKYVYKGAIHDTPPKAG